MDIWIYLAINQKSCKHAYTSVGIHNLMLRAVDFVPNFEETVKTYKCWLSVLKHFTLDRIFNPRTVTP